MDKLDMVIKAWECCNPFNRRCFECPYEADCFHDSFDRVAIADMVKLLKEQKNLIDCLVEDQVKKIDEMDELLKEKQSKSPTWRRGKAFCGGCGGCLENKEQHSSDIVQSIRFCKWCGVPVDWSNE